MKINVWRHGAIVHDSVEGHETQIMELNKHMIVEKIWELEAPIMETVPMDGLSQDLSETWKIAECFISRHVLRVCNFGGQYRSH